MQSHISNDDIEAAPPRNHRKQFGIIWLEDDPDAEGMVDIHPAYNSQDTAYSFLRRFETEIESMGRRDVDLLQVGICESQSILSKYIPLRPPEGWSPGAFRFRSLAARAKPGVGHLLFVLVATPSKAKVSYELKVGFQVAPWFYWPMLPVELLWCFVAGYQHEADIHSGNKSREPFKGIFAGIKERTLLRKDSYLPLLMEALASAIEHIEGDFLAQPPRKSDVKSSEEAVYQPPGDRLPRTRPRSRD
jgi:hypothetical protein